jgi:hypothetical protein
MGGPRRTLTADGISCSKCGQIKPFSEFRRRAGKRDGEYYAWCKPCSNAVRRAWAARNPGKEREYDLKYHYGLTMAEYEAMYESQDGRCAICCTPKPAHVTRGASAKQTIGLVVDHDHTTGAVRALLCHRCNNALGCVSDDISILLAAIEYLKKHA